MALLTISDLTTAADAGGYTWTYRKDGLTVIKQRGTVVLALYPTKTDAVSRMDLHGLASDPHVAKAVALGAKRKTASEVAVHGTAGQAMAEWLLTALAAGLVTRTTAPKAGPKAKATPSDAPKADPAADKAAKAKANRDARIAKVWALYNGAKTEGEKAAAEAALRKMNAWDDAKATPAAA